MGFFQSLYHSLYDVAWLASVRRERKRAWKLFFGFSALASLVLGLVLTAIAVPTISSLGQESLEKIPDFTARVASGTLHVDGIPQPLIQRFPEGPFLFVLDTVSSNTPTVENLVHDPKGEIVVINRERIEIFSEERGERKNYEMSDIGNGTLSKADMARAIKTVTSPVGIILIALFLIVVMFITLVVGHLIALLIMGLIAYFVAMIFKRPWQYSDLFTVGLFAPALPLLLTVILTLVGVGIPHLYSLSLLAFLLSVIVTAKPLPPEPPVAAENVSPKPQN